jgi:hypothetical protein
MIEAGITGTLPTPFRTSPWGLAVILVTRFVIFLSPSLANFLHQGAILNDANIDAGSMCHPYRAETSGRQPHPEG